MNKECEAIPVEHYPLTSAVCEVEARSLIFANLAILLGQLDLDHKQHCSTLKFIWEKHFQPVERLFDIEARFREFGTPWANLYYHNKSHGLYQTTFDAIAITKAALSRKDRFSAHLSAEGVVATVLAAIYHDSGYIYGMAIPENLAARTPVHVESGMQALTQNVTENTLPRFLDHNKVVKLAKLGIYATKFPYTQEVKDTIRARLDEMAPDLRKEAQIVRLTTQFADLGGQIARVDYHPTQLRFLRSEMDAAGGGLGTALIGKDHELANKCRGFIEKVAYPLLERTGLAFFKTQEHAFKKAWDQQGS